MFYLSNGVQPIHSHAVKGFILITASKTTGAVTYQNRRVRLLKTSTTSRKAKQKIESKSVVNIKTTPAAI